MKPILFSTLMVQALLRGEKTQTRRKIKPTSKNGNCGIRVSKNKDGIITEVCGYDEDERCWDENGSPYSVNNKYRVGDVLWVRETFQIVPSNMIFYKADPENKAAGNWKPSIFMPKEAARIFLKVKEVRVEKVQDISESDAIEEGIIKLNQSFAQLLTDGIQYLDYSKKPELFNDGLSGKESYKSLWEKINGPGSWDLNPWVWVYNFERIEKEVIQ